MMVVDEHSGLKFSQFYETKGEIVEPTCELFNEWNQKGIPELEVQYNKGDINLKLEQIANGNQWNPETDFEYTGRITPQRNSLSEVGLANIGGRKTEVIYHGNVPVKEPHGGFKGAIQYSIPLDGSALVEINGKRAMRYDNYAPKQNNI